MPPLYGPFVAQRKQIVRSRLKRERETGLRICVACQRELPLEQFLPTSRRGTPIRTRKCEACYSQDPKVLKQRQDRRAIVRELVDQLD